MVDVAFGNDLYNWVWSRNLSQYYFELCEIIGGGMVTVMSKDGKPTQIPASVLSTVGSSLAGSWIS